MTDDAWQTVPCPTSGAVSLVAFRVLHWCRISGGVGFEIKGLADARYAVPRQYDVDEPCKRYGPAGRQAVEGTHYICSA
jgi:hypothetical protein